MVVLYELYGGLPQRLKLIFFEISGHQTIAPRDDLSRIVVRERAQNRLIIALGEFRYC